MLNHLWMLWQGPLWISAPFQLLPGLWAEILCHGFMEKYKWRLLLAAESMMKLVKIFSKQTYKESGMHGMDDRHSSSTEIRGAFWGILSCELRAGLLVTLWHWSLWPVITNQQKAKGNEAIKNASYSLMLHFLSIHYSLICKETNYRIKITRNVLLVLTWL